MYTSQDHRYAVVVAICVLALIAMGAYVTSLASASQPMAHAPLDANLHRRVALMIGVLAAGLAVWQSSASTAPYLGWVALGSFVIDGWAGWLGWPILHAGIAPMVFAFLVVIGVVTASGWNEATVLVDDRAAPRVRLLAAAAPPLVLLQNVLGAAYRHKLTGVIPHVLGAMIVTFTVLVAATQVLQQYPKHRALRTSAIWLMTIVLMQVTLGAAAFAMKLLDLGGAALVISATSHVVTGSLLLAASVVFAMQVQRHVRRALA